MISWSLNFGSDGPNPEFQGDFRPFAGVVEGSAAPDGLLGGWISARPMSVDHYDYGQIQFEKTC